MKNFNLLSSVILVLLTVIFFIMFQDLVLAQDPPPPAFGPGPSQTPIDGGLALLAAGGAGYAIKKFRDRKKVD